MRVRMLKDNWPYRRGGTVTVKDEVANRWIARNIAEQVVVRRGRKAEPGDAEGPKVETELESVEPQVEDEQVGVEEVEEEVTDDEGPDLADLSIHELRRLAKEEGVEGTWRMTKKALIEAVRR